MSDFKHIAKRQQVDQHCYWAARNSVLRIQPAAQRLAAKNSEMTRKELFNAISRKAEFLHGTVELQNQ